MIKFSAQNALVHNLTPVMEIPSKTGGQSFFKRELIINDSWDKDGKHFTNFVSVEFSGDKLQLLDGIRPGQRVNVEGLLSGREYNGKIYNSVRGLTVTSSAQGAPPAPAAPMPGYPQPSAPGINPQQTMPGAAAPMAAAYPPQQYPQQYPQQTMPGADDLPF